MKNNFYINFIYILFSPILLTNCSQRNNIIDIDLSNLPKPKKTIEKENKKLINPSNKQFIKDLTPLKDKDNLLSKFKFGKKDPFSEAEFNENKLTSEFKLTGFLSTKVKQYVFVNYLGKEGTISEESIGGVNTNLLPKGAKVVNIDPKFRKLIINFENENFVFEL